MEGGDIAAFSRPERACIFEGLLASPPQKFRMLFKRAPEDTPSLKGWRANEMPLKSLVDSTNRLGVHTLVFTLMGASFEDEIYRWLIKKGVTCTVFAYDSLEEAIDDFKYNRGLHTIMVADQEMAFNIGIRAKVVSTEHAWSN